MQKKNFYECNRNRCGLDLWLVTSERTTVHRTRWLAAQVWGNPVFTETGRKLPREQGSLTMTPFFVTEIVSVLGALFSFEQRQKQHHFMWNSVWYIYGAVNSSRRFSCKEENRSGLTVVKHDAFSGIHLRFNTDNAKKSNAHHENCMESNFNTNTTYSIRGKIYTIKMYRNTLVWQCILIITQYITCISVTNDLTRPSA